MVPTDDFSFDHRVFLQPLRTYCNHDIIECTPIVLSAKVKTAIPSEEQVLFVAAYVLPPDDNSVNYWQCSVFQRNSRMIHKPYLPNVGNKTAFTLCRAKSFLVVNIFSASQENFPRFIDPNGS